MFLKDRYINPFTDFGFKKIFGSEVNKELLIAFLNTLLPPEAGTVADLSFLPNEQVGRSEYDRRAIFDCGRRGTLLTGCICWAGCAIFGAGLGPLPGGWVHGFWGRDVILFSSLLLHVSKSCIYEHSIATKTDHLRLGNEALVAQQG